MHWLRNRQRLDSPCYVRTKKHVMQQVLSQSVMVAAETDADSCAKIGSEEACGVTRPLRNEVIRVALRSRQCFRSLTNRNDFNHMNNKDLKKKCVVCGRFFSWRKKWERCWENVRYCSERCRSQKNKRDSIKSFNCKVDQGTFFLID